MEPGEYDITIHRGKTFSLELAYSDDTGVVDLGKTYDTARMQIRPAVFSLPPDSPVPGPLLELTTGNGRLVLGANLTITISAADTAALPWTTGRYDLELVSGVSPNEVVDALLFGKVTVKGEVTV